LNDRMRFAAFDVDHKTNTTSFMFVFRIIQALLRGWPGSACLPARFLLCFSGHAEETLSPVRIKLNFNSFYLKPIWMQYLISKICAVTRSNHLKREGVRGSRLRSRINARETNEHVRPKIVCRRAITSRQKRGRTDRVRPKTHGPRT
jgi:hypothetical protein